jgi:hypothetical protein
MYRREVFRGFWWRNVRGKNTLRKPRRRLENNIKIYLQDVVWGYGLD